MSYGHNILDEYYNKGAPMIMDHVPDYKAEAERGFNLLKSYYGTAENPFLSVDLRALNMDSCERCVLGQIFGHFDEGLETLDIIGSEYGFDIPSNYFKSRSENIGAYDHYAALTKAWKELIEQEQTNAGSSP